MATDISDLSGVGPATVQKLKSAGAESLGDLAEKEPEELIESGVGEKKARRLITEAKRDAVIIQSGEDVVDEYSSKSRVTTGMGALDEAVGGGWEEGDMVAIYGGSGTGKSQLGYYSLVKAVEATGDAAVLIETERNRFSVDRIKALSDDEDTYKKIHRVKAYDLDTQFNSYGKVAEMFNDISIVVVDSFTSRFRLSDQFEDRGSLSQRSTVMGRHLTELEKMAEEVEAPVLLTAQIYQGPSQYSQKEYAYGGSLFMHTVSYMIRMREGQGEMKEAAILNHPGKPESQLGVQIGEDSLKAYKE